MMLAAEVRARDAVRKAIAAFGDGVVASEWLARPNPALDNRPPLHVARESEEGLARVVDLLAAHAREVIAESGILRDTYRREKNQ